MSDAGGGFDDRFSIDLVSQLLDEAELDFGQLDALSRGLVRSLERQNPEQVMYLVPAFVDFDNNKSEFTGPELANEIRGESRLGQSFVNLFIAGAMVDGGVENLRTQIGMFTEGEQFS